MGHPNLRELREKARDLDRVERARMLGRIKSRSVGKPETKFTFDGTEYEYLYHDYNETWDDERTVEVPIVWKIVQDGHQSKILEVGNVLSHYFDTHHVIVDKYEKAPGVLNQDIVDYEPTSNFDLIVSISTLEHIGWSTHYGPRDPPKFLRAVRKLTSLLNPGGRLWFTVPLGYNSYVDEKVDDKSLGLTKAYFMKRITRDNIWKQCEFEDTRGVVYGGFKIRETDSPPFPKANAILIGMISPAG